MSCKYGCAESRKINTKELTQSPVFYGSPFVKYRPMLKPQQILRRIRSSSSDPNKYDAAIKDRQNEIDYLNRRQLLRGHQGYYDTQITILQKAVKDLQKQRDLISAQHTELVRRLTPYNTKETQTEPTRPDVLTESESESEAESEEEAKSEEDEEVLNKKGAVFMFLLDRNPGASTEQLGLQVDNMTEADLDRYLGIIPEKALKKYEEKAGYMTIPELVYQHTR